MMWRKKSQKNSYYTYQFDEEYVREVMGKAEEKNEALGNFDNLDKKATTRYAGHLGEDTFEEYLKDRGVLSYERFSDLGRTVTDKLDFKVGPYHIDVKTVVTNYYPRPDYACNVIKDQLERSKYVNAYVFARYLLNAQTGIVMGFLTKDELINKARLYKKGEQSKVRDSFKFGADSYEVDIKDLNPLSILILNA